ncbi:MAG: ATP-dependent helicase, partial [Gorillibacterium sp.]|nr:ATP-dependent helicase [Gorillibacterium sp.]
MTTLGTYTIEADWLEEGALFLWGKRGQSIVPAEEVKDHLFAWHEPSFYGTFVETVEQDYRMGVKLSAQEAFDYFCHTPPLVHADYLWSETAEDLRQLSPYLRSALENGCFMPDYEQWKHGSLGWRLELPDEASP